MGPKPRSIVDRFYEKIDKGDDNDCWMWKGAISTNGYGAFRINNPRTMVSAHRFLYILINGPISPGLFICHTCDQKLCCNPSHLFLGTPKINTTDMWQKGRGKTTKGYHVNQGSKHGAAKLTENQIREIRKIKNDYTYHQLAQMFNVSASNINLIINGKAWIHVK